jgi:hypothetical protein
MALMQRFSGIREARKNAKEIIDNAIINDQGDTSVYLLRSDGDTEVFRAAKAVHGGYGSFMTKQCGWLTKSMSVDPSDIPCLIW